MLDSRGGTAEFAGKPQAPEEPRPEATQQSMTPMPDDGFEDDIPF